VVEYFRGIRYLLQDLLFSMPGSHELGIYISSISGVLPLHYGLNTNLLSDGTDKYRP